MLQTLSAFLLRRARWAACALPLAACDISTTDPDAEPDLGWLRDNAAVLSTTEPGGSLADLAPFGRMVGNARIVGLGEATHGTREFFRMKHRALEYLVREKGFTVFGIEATWAEANRINDYVHGGPGDPAVLLSHLYFWTWNTREVLEMIQWMRAYNQTVGAARKVSFYGFDMQYSRVAMNDVVAYVQGVDAAAADSVRAHYACYRRYEDNLRVATPNYFGGSSAEIRAACRAGVTAVHALLERRAAEFTGRSGRRSYDLALRAARVVVQNEHMRATPSQTGALRDGYMAENAAWLGEVAEPGEKVVLWAHNAHVSRSLPWMGAHLAGRFGAEYLVAGFSFHRGTFNAVTFTGGGMENEAPPALETSFEHQFHRLGHPLFMVDLRPLRSSSPRSARWLRDPRPFRMVGSVYRPSTPDDVYLETDLVSSYHVMIHVEQTLPTQLLPFRYE